MNTVKWNLTRFEDIAMVDGELDTGDWTVAGTWSIDPQTSPTLAPMIGLRILARKSQTPTGISTTAMRDCEPFVLQLMNEFKQLDALRKLPDPVVAIHERAAEMKLRSPRADASYGTDLLALKYDLEAAGEQRTIKELSKLLDLPEGTLKTRLRVAERGGRVARPSDIEDDRG